MEGTRQLRLPVVFVAAVLLLCGLLPWADATVFEVPEDTPPIPAANMDVMAGESLFRFAVVSDRAGALRPGVFRRAVAELNMLHPDFVMCVGDLIEGYTEDAEDMAGQWGELREIVAGLEAPFFFVPGNHDVTNEVMAEYWRRHIGRSYYHFTVDDVLFLCLNTEDGSPTNISDAQVEYVEQALQASPDALWTLVFMHKPLWLYQDPPVANWARLEELLADRPHTMFAGHQHQYRLSERDGNRHFVLGTTGGGSDLLGPEFGSFDHIVWVTMTPAGPAVANLTLDGILPPDVATENSLEALEPLRQGAVVDPAPVQVPGGPFEGAVAQVTLRNPLDVPLHVAGRFSDSVAVRAVPATFDVRLAPGEVRVHEVRLDALLPASVEDIRSAEFEWRASCELPNGRQLERTDRSAVFFATPLACERRTLPVVVDGVLDEWTKLPFECSRPYQILHDPATWDGPEDSCFRFGVAYDEEYLYVAVEATDNTSFYDPDRMPWQQDGVEVRIDARSDPERSAGRGEGEFQDIIVVAMSPGETPESAVVYGALDQPVARQAACRRTSTGHVTEIAVPVSYLDGLQGGAWEAVRVNVCVDDFDHPLDAGAQIWWRPDWRSSLSFRGSGTLTRQ